eukprot:2178668-Alexandrium_andersonii.AAC.1
MPWALTRVLGRVSTSGGPWWTLLRGTFGSTRCRRRCGLWRDGGLGAVSYTHLRAHETSAHL